MFVRFQIVSSAKDAVTTARDVVAGTVSDTLNSVVGKTRGAVQGGVEKTRAAVSTVLESRVGRMVSSGVDTALAASESLVDQYLPLTEGELGEYGKPGRSRTASVLISCRSELKGFNINSSSFRSSGTRPISLHQHDLRVKN